jgi:large subunit ribosomal protein L15
MPLQRRIPKFGFKNPFRTEYSAVNIARLSQLVEEGRLGKNDEVTPSVLAGLGVVGKKDLVKILGGGEIAAPLKVSAHAFSASARSKIEAAGGTATVVSDRSEESAAG